MALDAIPLTLQHQQLLTRLSELVEDLDPDQLESLQRIFGLGLIALPKAKGKRRGMLGILGVAIAAPVIILFGAGIVKG